MACNIPLRTPRAPVLILDMLSAIDKPLSSYDICRAGTLMDISETAMRVSLTRLSSQGKIHRGERGQYSLVRKNRPLPQTVDQWKHKHLNARPWRNGDWLAVHNGLVTKEDRTQWRHHLLALSLCGFAELRPHLFIRPNNLRGGISAQVRRLRQLGMAPDAVPFRLTQLETAFEEQARRLWNVDAMATVDQQYLDALEQSQAQLFNMPLDLAVRETMLLGRAAIAHLVRDPVLPAQLMPVQARERLFQLTSAYQEQAQKLWFAWLCIPHE
ncbi:PaaX family transcriptional regulator [Lampropedia puyangensis]|uniref:PaaX family transcriptional regulator n=1 Tax=Lampropedia puyangensis TaxID=1330072 RepID=A0A4S8FD29_9BURK|nr:PaaX family transcriptional regulator [Lampropedia puyangensis]THU05061.1 PaaX family transcriptional regulator [Lampropedia puyangensis]